MKQSYSYLIQQRQTYIQFKCDQQIMFVNKFQFEFQIIMSNKTTNNPKLPRKVQQEKTHYTYKNMDNSKSLKSPYSGKLSHYFKQNFNPYKKLQMNTLRSNSQSLMPNNNLNIILNKQNTGVLIMQNKRGRSTSKRNSGQYSQKIIYRTKEAQMHIKQRKYNEQNYTSQNKINQRRRSKNHQPIKNRTKRRSLAENIGKNVKDQQIRQLFPQNVVEEHDEKMKTQSPQQQIKQNPQQKNRGENQINSKIDKENLQSISQLQQQHIQESIIISGIPKQIQEDRKYLPEQKLYSDETKQVHLVQNRYDSSKNLKILYKNISPFEIQYYKKLQIINHPNIVKYIDSYTEGNGITVITHYIEGVSFQQYKKYCNQENDIITKEYQIIIFFNYIQSLVTELQAKNVEHTKLSPDNLVISRQNVPILTQYSIFTTKIQQQYKVPSQISNKFDWFLVRILLELYFNQKISNLIKSNTIKTLVNKIKYTKIRQKITNIILPLKIQMDLNSNQKKFQKIKIKRKSKETQINDDIKFQQYSLRSDGEISFTTKICQKKTNKTMNIQEDPLNFNTSLIKLFHSYNYSSTIQIFHQIYKGCKKFVDPVQSKKTETKLKQQNANKPAPLLILGNALQKIGMNIHYTHQSTPFSFMSMLLLSLQIGLKERMIKSIIDFPITKQQFNANTCDTTKTEQMKQKIAKIIMEQQNNNHSPVITNIQWVNNQKIISQYYLNKNDQLKSRNQKQKEHKVKEISNQALVNELQLSPSDLDSRGDINFVQDHIAEMQIRAGLPYFQPNGWVRYGLNVSKFTQLDGNDNWLRMDGNDGEWAVYFHGLGNGADGDQVKKVAKIIIQTQFKAGWGQAHQYQQLFVPKALYNRLRKNPQALEQYKKEQKVGRGIYGSPLINEDCLGYTTGTQFGNQQYRVAFQCRIHPEKVYISDDVKSYWIVRDPKYIRRYGLLIGKVQDIEKQKNITTKFNKQYAEFKETKVNLNQQ